MKLIAFPTLNNLFESSKLLISIPNKNEVINLALKEDALFLKMMQFDHLYSNEDNGLISIEDLRALRLRKRKLKVISKPENTSLI